MYETRDLRDEARKLRSEGKSINKIADLLGKSKSTVCIWVKDIELTPEQRAALSPKGRNNPGQKAGAKANKDAAYLNRRRWQEEGRQRAREGDPLHSRACMLYWSEGAKSRGKVQFVNTDAQMMLYFMRFLREEFNLPNEEIVLHIHCHDQPVEEIRLIEQYWLSLLKLPPSQLRKTHIKGIGESRRNKLPHGVCTVTVHNTRLMQHIYGAIQEYIGFDRPEWLD